MQTSDNGTREVSGNDEILRHSSTDTGVLALQLAMGCVCLSGPLQLPHMYHFYQDLVINTCTCKGSRLKAHPQALPKKRKPLE